MLFVVVLDECDDDNDLDDDDDDDEDLDDDEGVPSLASGLSGLLMALGPLVS